MSIPTRIGPRDRISTVSAKIQPAGEKVEPDGVAAGYFTEGMPSLRRTSPWRGDSPKMGVVHPLPIEEDDASLVEAVRRRQPGAAARLYNRHVDAVYGFLFRLLGPVPNLEDLLQDVFASALSGIERLREPSSLKQWLLAITVGRARTYIRWRRRKRWLSFLPSENSCPSPRPSTMKSTPSSCAKFASFSTNFPRTSDWRSWCIACRAFR